MRPSSYTLSLVASLLLCPIVSACGDDDAGDGSIPPRDLGPPPPPAAFASPNVAYEGQQRFVTTITASGLDLSGAVITPVGAALELVEARCNAARCGVHLRIRDTRSNAEVPDPVPAPISNRNEFLELTVGGQVRRAVVTVWPTQTLNGVGMASLRDALLASGGTVDSTGSYVGAPIGGPVRWFSMGPLQFAGTLDLSAPGAIGRVGGGAGGAPGANGGGRGGGRGASGGAGGGGGGHAVDGTAGDASDGTAGGGGAGGAPYGAPSTACLEDVGTTECGGSGGGGGAGEGGGGAGSLLIVSLEPLDLSGAALRARGADGVLGGGGGSGGNILIAAPSWTPPATLDVGGGAGEGAGGAGSAGHLRVDVANDTWSGAFFGPRLDPASAPLFAAETVTLRGIAGPGHTVHAERQDATGSRTSAVAGTDGAFELTVPLVAGSNRLRIIEDTPDGPVRGWIGNAFEFGTGMRCLTAAVCVPIGAFVDVVRME